VRYDLDTNYSWLSFRLQPLSAAELQHKLKLLSEEESRALKLRNPRGDFNWPEGFIQQQPANDSALYSVVFRGDGHSVPRDARLAFETGKTNVYVWVPSEAP